MENKVAAMLRPENKPQEDFDLDNLDFDIDETRLHQMQSGGMEMPEGDESACDGCTI